MKPLSRSSVKRPGACWAWPAARTITRRNEAEAIIRESGFLLMAPPASIIFRHALKRKPWHANIGDTIPISEFAVDAGRPCGDLTFQADESLDAVCEIGELVLCPRFGGSCPRIGPEYNRSWLTAGHSDPAEVHGHENRQVRPRPRLRHQLREGPPRRYLQRQRGRDGHLRLPERRRRHPPRSEGRQPGPPEPGRLDPRHRRRRSRGPGRGQEEGSRPSIPRPSSASASTRPARLPCRSTGPASPWPSTRNSRRTSTPRPGCGRTTPGTPKPRRSRPWPPPSTPSTWPSAAGPIPPNGSGARSSTACGRTRRSPRPPFPGSSAPTTSPAFSPGSPIRCG